jgi:hypothetical protein
MAATVMALALVMGSGTPAVAGPGTYISGASMDNRARAILYQFLNAPNQYWRKNIKFNMSDGTPVYEIINVKSGKCLDKSLDVPDADGNVVYQYDCLGANATNQNWYQRVRQGSVGRWQELVNYSDGRCLDIAGPAYTNAAVLHVWHCYDNAWSQQWNID